MANNSDKEHALETSTPKESIDDYSKDVTLQIKQEQLDIAKKWIQTGEVNIYRETFTEEKSFTVPVNREELVIEKKSIDIGTSTHEDMTKEVIRIPLNEEKIEFTKQRVDLEDVSIYKEQIQDIKHIEETLKCEEPRVKVSGSAKVSEKSNPKNF